MYTKKYTFITHETIEYHMNVDCNKWKMYTINPKAIKKNKKESLV